MVSLLLRQELAGLEAAVAMCQRCYGPERRHVVRFSRPTGRAQVLVLGERPPRSLLAKGDRVGLENGDPGMRFLRQLLEEAHIPEKNVLVGAAVMRRAAARTLEAAVPTGVCLKECAEHVRELVRLGEPRLIVPLGRTALRSVRLALSEHAEAEGLRFPESVGHSLAIGGRWVHPVYHVTLRARVTRREARQREDWRAVGRLWEWLEQGGKAGTGPSREASTG